MVEWESGAPRSGDLYFRILRGRNVATEWKHTVEPEAPSVSVLESGRQTTTPEPRAQLVAINIRTSERAELARGGIHRLRISGDERFIAFLKEAPGIPGQQVASYFERATDPEGMYDAVNWGTELHVLDSQSGAEVDSSLMPAAPSKPAQKTAPSAVPPRADSRLLSASPSADAALYIANASDGTHLWLAGGARRPMSSYQEVWKANDWIGEIRIGRAEPIEYTASDGTPLVAWLLFPPAYVPGGKLPMVTVVYPGTMYSAAAPPSSFSLFRTDFEHPQLFAALGYAVHSDTYRADSPLLSADKVRTPLMLVHGDLDFVPIQQAEEFFTALYRQDKRAVFVRYEGEWHTIANRANVLDLWRRIGEWLSETMPSR